jgi:hypothetical protein
LLIVIVLDRRAVMVSVPLFPVPENEVQALFPVPKASQSKTGLMLVDRVMV